MSTLVAADPDTVLRSNPDVLPANEDEVAPGIATDASRAAAGTVALAVLQTVGRCLALLFVLVATRMVAPSQFGRYSIIAGLVAFAGFIADFGSTTVITRVVSRDPESSDELLSQTLVASVVVGIAAYASVIAYLAIAPYSSSLMVAGLIGGLAIPFDAALTSMLAALDGHGLITRRAVVTFVRLAIVTAGGAIAVLATGKIEPAIAAMAAGPMVGCVLAAVLTRRYRVWSLALRPHFGRSLALFRMALPYALLGGIGAVVARLDLLVLSLFVRTGEVAQYDLALRAIEASTALGMVIGGPALYIMSRRLGSDDVDGAQRAYAHAIRVAYIVGIPASCVLVALHEPITRLAFGSSYEGSAVLLAILGASVWLAVLGWVQGAVVAAGGSTKAALKASIVLLAAAAILDAGLIPTIGAEGAALATVGAALVSCGVFDYLNRTTLSMRTPLPSRALVVPAVLVGLIMLLVASVVNQWLALALLPAMPLALWASGAVTTADLRRLKALAVHGNRA